jgi:peptidyl-prolyl cis-trans isomerase D
MLIEAIRRHSESWWFRAFLAILALTFGFLWYGNDILTGTRGGISKLASVGGEKISIQQFSQMLSQELSRLQGTREAPIPLEQQQKLYPYILETLVTNLLLKKEADRLGLSVTDEEIKRIITETPNFKNDKGIFEREKFNIFLQNIGSREKTFIENLRQDLLRREMVQTLVGGIISPQSMTLRMYSYENQRRLLALVSIESEKLTLDKNPSENEIADYFKKNPKKFTAPEARDISAIVLNPSLPQIQTIPTDAQLQQAYQERTNEFKDKSFAQIRPQLYEMLQKKTALQKLFELANKIDDALAGGASLEEISKSYGLKIETFSRVKGDGSYQKREKKLRQALSSTIESHIFKEAFKEKAGELTKVIESGEGTFFIARVDKIYPAHPLTYEESKTEAEKLLIAELKNQKAQEIALTIEAQVNRGNLFEMVAQQKGFNASRIRVNRKGPLAPLSFYLPHDFIEALYHTRIGAARVTSYLKGQNQRNFIVGSVLQIEPTPIKEAEGKIKAFKEKLNQELFNDLLTQYIASLRKIFPVEYNTKALERLLRDPS